MRYYLSSATRRIAAGEARSRPPGVPLQCHAFLRWHVNDRMWQRRGRLRSSGRDKRHSRAIVPPCRLAAGYEKLRAGSSRHRRRPAPLFRRGPAPVSVCRVLPSSSRVRDATSVRTQKRVLTFQYVVALRGWQTKKPLSGLFSSLIRAEPPTANLRGAGLYIGINAHLVTRAALVLELHDTVDQRINGEIAAEADVATWVPFRTALTDDDIAGDDLFTAELLDTAILRVAVAAVARRAYTFFMSHYFSPPLFLPKAISLMRTSVNACRWPCFFA